MSETFHTERLRLRRPVMEDLDDLVELDSDPEVMRFLTGGRATPRSVMETDRLPAWIEYAELESGYGFWIVELAETLEFLGWFHMRCKPDQPQDEPELGYRLVRSAWGKGYATEGSLALIEDAFARGNATRVYAETMSVNSGSRRVMEKCGLSFVRNFFVDWDEPIEGNDQGEVEYEITRCQWQSGSGS